MLLNLLKTPSLYASLAALLASLGIEVHQELFDRVAEAVAALAAIVGIIAAMRKPTD